MKVSYTGEDNDAYPQHIAFGIYSRVKARSRFGMGMVELDSMIPK